MCPGSMCPALYHTAIPYLLTFQNGGTFAWLRDPNAVEIQCPNPHAGITLKLTRIQRQPAEILIEVIGHKTACPYGMEKKDPMRWQADRVPFCPRALDSLFPYLNVPIPEKDPDGKVSLKVSCPGYPDRVIFEISKDSAP